MGEIRWWVRYVLPVLASFAVGLLVPFVTGWQQRRTALEARVIELEEAFRDCQEGNDRLRRRVGDLERALRGLRGWTETT